MVSRRIRLDLLVGFAVFAVAAAVLLVRLSQPHTFVFDEIYYANDSLDLITNGAERAFAAHPPLGKWLMAPGIELFGFNPRGWRFDAVLFGAGSVVLTYLLAFRLTASRALGLLAAALVLTDGIFFTSSRLAMLDAYLCFFCLLLLWLLTLRGPLRMWHVVLIGVVLGLAMAVKWSALLLVVVVPVVVALRADRASVVRRLGRAAAVLACAVVVYVASYSGWLIGGGPFGNCERSGCSSTFAGRLADLPGIQRRMVDYQTNLTRRNPYLAGGWTWLTQDQPTVLFREVCQGQSDVVCTSTDRGTAKVEGRGSYLLWWSAIVTVPGVAIAYGVQWRRRRRRTDVATEPKEPEEAVTAESPAVAVDSRVLTLLAFVVALYAPWIFNRDTYTFYATSLVPLLAVLFVWWLSRFARKRSHRLIAAAIVVLVAVIPFAFQWDSLVGLT